MFCISFIFVGSLKIRSFFFCCSPAYSSSTSIPVFRSVASVYDQDAHYGRKFGVPSAHVSCELSHLCMEHIYLRDSCIFSTKLSLASNDNGKETSKIAYLEIILTFVDVDSLEEVLVIHQPVIVFVLYGYVM